ncbi:CD82 antigen-like isoform X2 [Photinus pyralis]|uniref:CD82 antigen-like isoform X2 n=1 Tax=Photinus pyralis TaxID=7054 RepID=UPI00126776B0|nr:CD82 antigen-like isoform X2 [Photinus pyralis]
MCIILDALASPIRVIFCVNTKLYIFSGVMIVIMVPVLSNTKVGTYILALRNYFDVVKVGPPALIGFGVALIVIGLLGHYGASSGSTRCLASYMFLCVGLIVLEIIVATYVLMKLPKNSGAILKDIQNKFKELIQSYYTDPEIKLAIDFVQSEFECCGSIDRFDWGGIGSTPDSCTCRGCLVSYGFGCSEYIFDLVSGKLAMVPTIAYAVLGFQVL